MRLANRDKLCPMSSSSKGHWEFQWSADVQTFWDQHRRVPDRGLAKNYHEERFCLGLYLFALATHELLTYPLSVDQFEEHESPDFMMRWPSGETTGLEVTRATEEGLQKNKSAAHKEYRQRKVDAERSETEPEPVSIPLPTAGWTDGERERGWSLMFRNAVEKKLVKLRGEPPEFRSKFKPAARHDLLVYDDTPFIGVDRTRVIATMQNCIRDLSGQQRAFGKISFISSLDLIFDLGGECRMLPYVEWTKVVPEDRDSLMTLAHRVEEAAQIAVKKAIRSHADAGRAIHYTDSRGRIIKETPDGRRFELQLLENGEEVIVKEL